MRAVAEKSQPFVAEFQAHRESLSGESWMQDLRTAAIESFDSQGLPTRRDEEWRYLDLKPVAKGGFGRIGAPGKVDPRVVAEQTISKNYHRLVFVDGHCDHNLSFVDGLPDGVELLSVAEAIEKKDAPLKQVLLRSEAFRNHPFVALNTAFMEDGFFLGVKPGVRLDKPLQILFLNSAAAERRANHPRNFIHLAENAAAEIVETYACDLEAPYFTNVVAEVSLEKGAHLVHHRIQSEGAAASHLNLMTVGIRESARFESNVFSFGATTSRNEIEVSLQGKQAYCALNGVYLADADQCMDNRTVMDHQQADGTSRQFYKGVLSGKSRGVFNGKVLVRPDAQRTDAEQNNRNLLLSDDAEADAKPQLEIYADDVKCSHGATVGQLDTDSIFYLRARGIGEKEARAMLTVAFALDLLEAVEAEEVREFISARIDAKLSGEAK